MSILIDKKYNWRHLRDDALECWYVGSETAVRKLTSYLNQHPGASVDDLKETLYNLYGNFAVIIREDNRIIAAVDKIRSYPLFYCQEANRFQVSNSARALKAEWNLNEIDDLSLLEFRMAGYVTGRETLFRGLSQAQAGELLVWEKEEKRFYRERYYLFYTDQYRQEKKEVLIDDPAMAAYQIEGLLNRVLAELT